MIQLSILIASTPSRWDMTRKLYDGLIEMVGDKKIEVLLFMDDKKRSIGAKREALKNIANGKYFCFCDSDDNLTGLDDIYEATSLDVDVITYKAECRNNDGSTFVVTQNLDNPTEHNTFGGRYLDCLRPPYPNCAWNQRFKKYYFPDISYGEDGIWVDKCLNEATTEHHIPKILFKYNFNLAVTEASTESNPYWTNPNEISNNQR